MPEEKRAINVVYNDFLYEVFVGGTKIYRILRWDLMHNNQTDVDFRDLTSDTKAKIVREVCTYLTDSQLTKPTTGSRS